ncbi:formyltransferase family protein [uncultured Algibacter sp.]|uniref:formyltransferase family protein n=1 Tax=uncultured Algibacter sp. TaxID=298659 RepID=UPI00263239AE|nr:formyltransferase family protein [uncultured Algibacter sp.]
MGNKKNIVLIGSRVYVIEELLKDKEFINLSIYALKNSFLETYSNEKGLVFKTFSMDKKQKCLDELLALNFDVLISNGCPILFPVNRFGSNQILINVHPTYLPHLQGKTPMNGVFYLDYDFYGATMHYIDNGVDTGDIIYQQKEELTNDIDLGLLYHLAMSMEGVVFIKGWKKLKEADFKNIGIKQLEKGTYFNRTITMQTLNFEEDNTVNLLRKIKSFGVDTQGCIAKIELKNYKIFEAEVIIHIPLLKKFENAKPGELVLNYDGNFLIKTIDGLLKIKKYELII